MKCLKNREMAKDMDMRRAARKKRVAGMTAAIVCASLLLGQTGKAAAGEAGGGNGTTASGAAGGGVMLGEGSRKSGTAGGVARWNGMTASGAAGGVARWNGMTVSGIPQQAVARADAAGRESGAKEASAGGSGIMKEETVYVLAGPDGSVGKIIVSDWLQNGPGAGEIIDRSELDQVENVKGDEGYTPGPDDAVVWDARGKDIYYRGIAEKELPVDLKVTYALDGKEISPRELAGKSGKVTIRFDYTNRQYEYVEIKGEEARIYVPYAVMTGLVLDNEVFTNVETANARLVNDGDRTMVVGMAFPGLAESLAAAPDKLAIPDYVEITADVENFEMGMTITVISNDVFNKTDEKGTGGIGLKDGQGLENLGGSLDELTDAMGRLSEGSDELYDGLCTLLAKSGGLADGIDGLESGTARLKAGADSLADGAGTLRAGALKLQNGLDNLTSGNEELNGGARRIFDMLLSDARTQLQAAGIEVPAMTPENYGGILDAVISSMGQDAEAKGVQSVMALKASLDGYNAFYLGLQAYTAGVAEASLGAGELSQGMESLVQGSGTLLDGASRLYEGITVMKDSVPALTEGVTALRDGAKQLADGVGEFDEKAARKLADAVEGGLDGLTERMRAISDVSDNYKSFAGIREDMEGSVKFIYRTEAVEIGE